MNASVADWAMVYLHAAPHIRLLVYADNGCMAA